jgi:pimeloyl-ACP methyl ester carboxylesterase
MRLHLLVFGVALLVSPIFAQRHVSIPVPEPSSDNVAQIEANVYGTGSRALLLAHGGRFNKESWRKQAPVFARAGFLVLAINYRGDTFNADGSPSALGSDDDNAIDVEAAVAYLHRIGVKSVSAIGASLGGDAVGDAEAQSSTGLFDKMIFLGSEGGDAPEKLRGRKLFIVAREDSNGSGPRLPGISRRYQQAPEPKQLIVLDGSAHAQYLFETEEGPKLMREILHFLQAK